MNLIKVSRASILNKVFNVTEEYLKEKLTGDELALALTALPTAEEKEWMRINESNAPELERIRRKNSVCLDAEIETLEDDKVVYVYNNKLYTINEPINSFNVAMELEKSRMKGFAELCAQGCVLIAGKKLVINKDNVKVDELSLLIKIADKFFFQTYIS